MALYGTETALGVETDEHVHPCLGYSELIRIP
jgi:hypothetical protein